MLSFFFPLQNAVCFIILTYLVSVLFTFYIKDVLKLKKKNNSGAKRLTNSGSHLILPPSHLETDGYKLRYALTIMTVFETLHDKAHVCTGRHTVEYYVMCARSVIYGGIYEGIKERLGWTPSPYLQSSD